MMADLIKSAGKAWPAKEGAVLAASPRELLAGVFLAATLVVAGPATGAPPARTPAAAATPATSPETSPAAVSGSEAAKLVALSSRLDKTLDNVAATDDQKARIKTILITSLGSLTAVQPMVREAPGELKHLLTTPTIDRVALERLRAQLIVELDQASKTLVQGLADAADVLTPQQRAKLAATLAERPPRIPSPAAPPHH